MILKLENKRAHLKERTINRKTREQGMVSPSGWPRALVVPGGSNLGSLLKFCPEHFLAVSGPLSARTVCRSKRVVFTSAEGRPASELLSDPDSPESRSGGSLLPQELD